MAILFSGAEPEEVVTSASEQNHLCNFSRGYLEEQFCVIILNLDHWFRRRCN